MHVPKEEATQGCQGHHPDKHVACVGDELQVALQLQQMEGQQTTELVLLLLLAHPASCAPLMLHRWPTIVLCDLSRLQGVAFETPCLVEVGESRNKAKGV